ncbi:MULTISPECIES: membrane protein insertase YidC [Agromyces]|uniref:YidC/Oxa1 family membrane protein insertase n=1 Tax=Agromyces TaxID=33877 RepID=UPI001E30490D|nr:MULTISPECIES: membrane protein insertase YidC [Agromyces]MCD1570614.1 membrane protein insertase YidC [Agromyces mediolanus]GLU89051.1 membrane protein [Agromyces sp. NBRC 114283]
MDLYAFPPIAAVIDGAYTLLMGLAGLLEPLLGGAAAAASVVLVTLLVRAALIPVGVALAKGEQTRARIAPKLQELQRKHANNPERLQREFRALYAEEGTSPFAGCLPMLVQAPVVGIIYALFILPVVNGHPNLLLDQTLLGVPLGHSLVGTIAAGAPQPLELLVFAGLVVAIAAVGFLTLRAARPGGPLAVPRPATSAAPAPAAPGAPAMPDLSKALLPLHFLTAGIAMFVPLAAGLYLLTTVAWTLVQRLVLRRRYPLG